MTEFDYFIAIDWSSRAKPSSRQPSKDAIWLAEGAGKGRIITRYYRTRHECYTFLRARLQKLTRQGKRVFIGWDFAFGYPKGFAKALRLGRRKPWKKVWRHLHRCVTDKPTNENNRFTVGGNLNRQITGGSGPFWGVPSGQSGVFLHTRKDFKYPVRNKRVSLPERRLVEQRHRKMQSPWKLAYTGSVGGQSLLGIPRLYQLVFEEPKLKEVSLVWPFQTKFADRLPRTGPILVHAEIYPSSLKMPGKDKIPDREQVRTYVNWLRVQQQKGTLGRYLAGPKQLSLKERRQVLRHEGWVFGVD